MAEQRTATDSIAKYIRREGGLADMINSEPGLGRVPGFEDVANELYQFDLMYPRCAGVWNYNIVVEAGLSCPPEYPLPLEYTKTKSAVQDVTEMERIMKEKVLPGMSKFREVKKRLEDNIRKHYASLSRRTRFKGSGIVPLCEIARLTSWRGTNREAHFSSLSPDAKEDRIQHLKKLHDRMKTLSDKKRLRSLCRTAMEADQGNSNV
jgi:hypothetical protein